MDFGEKRNPLCLTKLGCAKRMVHSLFFSLVAVRHVLSTYIP